MDYNDSHNVQCDQVVKFLRTTAAHDLLSGGPCRLLELGCGTGPFGRRLLEEYPLLHVTGVEVLPEPIDALRQILARDGLEKRYEPVVADIGRAEIFDADRFDFILAPSVLHHIPGLIRSDVPRNICRWTRTGGQMMIYDPNGANPVQQASNQVMRVATQYFSSLHKHKWPGETMYSPAYYRRVFLNNGFEYVHGFTHDPFMPVRGTGVPLLGARNLVINAVALVTWGEWRGAGQSSLYRKI
jgi:SAM-dependent methyltransferase